MVHLRERRTHHGRTRILFIPVSYLLNRVFRHFGMKEFA